MMKKWIGALLFLLTSISITGFSFVDNLILNRIVAILGIISFFIVGLLYNAGAIVGKSEGSKAYKTVFLILIILVLLIYLGIRKFQESVLTWPLYVKILVPSVLGVLTLIILIWAIYDYMENSDKYE